MPTSRSVPLRAPALALALASCGGTTDVEHVDTDAGTSSTGGSDESETTSGHTDPVGDDDDSTGESPEALVWQSDCTLGGTDFGALHPDLECTGLEVPLDWFDPRSQSVQVAAFRVRSSATTHVGQIWLLDGGPGGSGLGFFESPILHVFLDAGFDVVAPAHRGIISPRLRCSLPGTSACRTQLEEEWGDDLRHFSTLQAAADLGELIERAQIEETGRTVVYGVSYGTLWGQYYLARHPNQADAVILDGVLPMNAPVLEQKVKQQELALDLLQRCIDDASCGDAVGFASGAAFATAVVEAVDSTTCGSLEGVGWLSSGLRQQLGVLLNTPRARSFLPLVAAMIQSCDPGLTAQATTALPKLQQYSASLEAPSSRLPLTTWSSSTTYSIGIEHYFSPELYSVVTSTSVLPDDGDPHAVREQARPHLVAIGMGEAFLQNYDLWGDIPNAEVPLQHPAEIPVLVLSAAYDLQTPVAWARNVAEGLEQPLLVIDDAGHGVLGGGADETVTHCAREVVLSFAVDGHVPGDRSCVSDGPLVDVNLGTPVLQAYAEHAFETADPWSLLFGR
mgnify:CR=1 FL=1